MDTSGYLMLKFRADWKPWLDSGTGAIAWNLSLRSVDPRWSMARFFRSYRSESTPVRVIVPGRCWQASMPRPSNVILAYYVLVRADEYQP